MRMRELVNVDTLVLLLKNDKRSPLKKAASLIICKPCSLIGFFLAKLVYCNIF